MVDKGSIIKLEEKRVDKYNDNIFTPQRKGIRRKGSKISQGKPQAQVAGYDRSGTSGTLQGQGASGYETGGKLNKNWDLGKGGVASGHPLRNTGVGDRLETTPTQPHDVILDQLDIGERDNPPSRFDSNLQAITTLKTLEAEGRQATPTEQAILAKYSGFGDSGFNPAFPRYGRHDTEAWKSRAEALKTITTEKEYEAIEKSRLNAFYTPPEIIKTMWDGLRRVGIDELPNIRVLEPSSGAGRFLGYQPKDLTARSHRTAVELDELTGRIVKHLYPDAETYVMGFQNAPIRDNSIDVAISNVPFGDFPVFDKEFTKGRRMMSRQIHNYFFAKTLDKLRPGGVLAFITSHGTLDSRKAQPIREELSKQADLIQAIRLPKGAFPDTEVVTDIIFMRKRETGESPGDTSWVDTEEIEIPKEEESYYTPTAHINSYFVNNPDMVMGKHSTGGSMYRRDEYSVEPSQDWESKLQLSIKSLPENQIKEYSHEAVRKEASMATIGAKENAYAIAEDGKLYVRRGNDVIEPKLSSTEVTRIRRMLGVRDAARQVLNAQLKEASDSELTEAQANLNGVYDDFVTEYGALSHPDNSTLMKHDPDGPFLKALERIPAKDKLEARIPTIEADKYKMPLFNLRVIKGMPERTVRDESDAISVSLNESGRLDFKLMSEILGRPEKQLIKDMADKRLIYNNPMGDWEESEKYLTGDVRDKLMVAKSAVSADAAYNPNVEALTLVQPEDLPPSQISARLGAPWISADYVNEFLDHLLDIDYHNNQYYRYVPETGEWLQADKPYRWSAKLTTDWGTERLPANDIIHRLLNGKAIEVKDKDDDGKSVRNPKETFAAQEKARLIENTFERWLWEDGDRAKTLAEIYNTTYNNYRPRQFDGSHQHLPGMDTEWAKRIHPHQKDAIWRVVQDRTSLLAHEVGFGKTAVMVGSGMELRRLGIAQKNLYVVPKATHSQFVEQFKDIYPYANILAPDEKDFTPANRQEFVSRAVTGDWDAIVLSDSQFRRIPVKPETQMKMLQEEKANLMAAILAEEQSEGDSGSYYQRRSKAQSKTHKELQKALERLEQRLQETMFKVRKVTDETMFFEDMGVDQLYVDEADMFKNLRFTTRMGRLKGLPNTDSERAWDMYMKTRHILRDKKQGVVFATGTPVANTIAEMYTMMRYLQEPMMEAKGIQHFDAWAKTFGQTTESLEQSPTGAYRMTQRFAKFNNAPELSNIWQQVADIRVADEVPAVVKQRPRLVDDEGKARRTVISTPPDDELLAFMKELAARADNLPPDPREDNMLKIASDARMASLDMRMVKPGAQPNPEGKIAVCARKVAEIYREETPQKGTQLVFLDIGTPKATDKVSEETGEDAEVIETGAEPVLRNVYGKIKEHLIDAGVPIEEIAFVHDAKNDRQRLALWDKVNRGDIRVMIGSTGKMGTGVNVQERAAAVHHLDAPWRPRDIEQREGRVIRQGNIVYGPQRDESGQIIDQGKGVRVYNYVTERSFDGYMWQAIESKSKAIKAIMRRDNPPRNIEDIDSLTMSAAEAKAVASGDPDVLKTVSLRNSVNRLQMLRAAHTDTLVRARVQLKDLPSKVKELNNDITEIQKDIKKAETKDEDFKMVVEGKTHTERKDAGEQMTGILKGTKQGDDKEIGSYRGFKLRVINQGPGEGYRFIIESPDSGRSYGTTSIPYSDADGSLSGAITRIGNRINSIPSDMENSKQEMATSERNINTYKGQAEGVFEHEERLAAMEKELTRLEKKLQGEEVGAPEHVELLDDEALPGEKKPEYRFTPKEDEPKPEPIRPAAGVTPAKTPEAVKEPEPPPPPEPKKVDISVGKISEGITRAKELHKKQDLYVYEVEDGKYKVSDEPPENKPHIVINPDGGHQIVTKAAAFEAEEALGHAIPTKPEDLEKRQKVREEKEKTEQPPEAVQAGMAELPTQPAKEPSATAYEYGRIAREQGIIKASAQDKAFLDDYIKGKPVGDKEGGKALEEWNKGYQEAHQEITDREVKEKGIIPVSEKIEGKRPKVEVATIERLDFTAPEPPKAELEIGEALRIRGVDSILMDKQTSGDGVVHEIFRSTSPEDDRASIRMIDKDSDKVIAIKQYPDYNAAERGYKDLLDKTTPLEIKPKTEQKEKTKPRKPRVTKIEKKPPKLKTKKVVEKKRKRLPKGESVPVSDFQAIQSSRSDRAKAADISRSHQRTITPTDPYVKAWMVDQGRADIRGVDTPSTKKLDTTKSPVNIKPRKPKPTPKPKMIAEKKHHRLPPKERLTVSSLREIQENRSDKARMMDATRSHQATINPDHPTVKRWVKDQGVADVLGIDNPPNVTKPTRSTDKVTYRKGKVKITEKPDDSKPIINRKPIISRRQGKARVIELGGGIVQEGKRRHLKLL